MAGSPEIDGQLRRCRVAVLGLSGTQKGQFGVGKSCLCNRFVTPSQADYREDHTSQLNNVDFLGPVINRDHFLFWGRTEKTSSGGRTTLFEIVEQTEFEDENFQPLSRSGEFTTYLRAASNLKLSSPGKLAYIHKDQLSLPSEYTQVPFPERFSVDGFLVVVDVSRQRAATQPSSQHALLGRLLPTLTMMKRPVVVVATKCDDLSAARLDMLEAIVHKHLKSAPIVCTSARNAVNVDDAFFALDQLVERRGAHIKVLSYAEAARQRQLECDEVVRRFSGVLTLKVTNFHGTWHDVQKRLAADVDFQKMMEVLGGIEARRMTLQHLKQLRNGRKAHVAEAYGKRLQAVFQALLPSTETANLTEWGYARELIRRSADYSAWFVVDNATSCWDDEFLLDYDSKLLPDDVLDDDLAREAYASYLCKLVQEKDERKAAEALRSLLEEAKDELPPGTDWQSAKLVLQNNPRYNKVVHSDSLAQRTYKEFQQELQKEYRNDFYELVLQNIAVFGSTSSAHSTSDNSILAKKIENELKGQEAYERLKNRPDDRSFVILKVLALRQRPPLSETVWNCIAKLPSQSDWLSSKSKWSLFSPDKPLCISVMGLGQLGHELERHLRDQCCNEKLTLPNGDSYPLRLRVALSGKDISTAGFVPQGLIGVISSKQSAKFLRHNWTNNLLADHDKSQRAALLDGKILPLRGIPVVIVCIGKTKKEREAAKEHGEELATDLQCPLVWQDNSGDTQLVSVGQAVEAVSNLIHAMQHRCAIFDDKCQPSSYVSMALCCLHDDLLIAERILGPLLSHQCCVRPVHDQPDERKAFLVDVCVNNSLQLVKFTLHSSLNDAGIRRDPHHGFIIVQDSERRASMAVAKHLMERLPEQVPRVLLIQLSDERGKDATLTETVDIVLNFGAAMLPATSTAFNQFLQTVWKQRYSSMQEQGIVTPKSRRRTPAPLPPTPDLVEREENGCQETQSVQSPVVKPRKKVVNKSNKGLMAVQMLERRSMSEGSIFELVTNFDQSEDGGESPKPCTSMCTPSAATSATSDEPQTQAATSCHNKAYCFRMPDGDLHIYDNRVGLVRDSSRRAFSESHDMEFENEQPSHSLVRSGAGIGYSSVTRGLVDDDRSERQGQRRSQLTRSEARRWPDARSRTVRHHSPGRARQTFRTSRARTSVSELIEHFNQSDSSNDNSPQLQRKGSSVSKQPLGRQVRLSSQSFSEILLSPENEVRLVARTPPPAKRKLEVRTSDSHLLEKRASGPPLLQASRSIDSLSFQMDMLSSAALAADLAAKRKAHHYEEITGDDVLVAAGFHSYAKVHPSNKATKRAPKHTHKKIPQILQTEPSFTQDNCNLPLSPSRRNAHFSSSIRKAFRHSVMGEQSWRFSGSSDDQAPGMSPNSDDSDSSCAEGPELPRRAYLDPSDTDEDRMSDIENNFLKTLPSKQDGENSQGTTAALGDSVMLRRQQTIRMHEELQLKFWRKRESKEQKRERERAKKERKAKKRMEKEVKARRKGKHLSPSHATRKPATKESVGREYFGHELHDLPPPDNTNVPRFVQLCAEYIEEHGLESVGIYRLSGMKRIVEQIMEDYDKDPSAGLSVDNIPRVNAVASAFKAFFRELPDSLVPTVIIPRFVACLRKEEEQSQLSGLRSLIVHGLPPHNRIILKYLCEHLYRVSQHSDVNKMVAQNLSVVFCVNIMWPRNCSDEKLVEMFNDNSSTTVQELPQLLERVLTLLISRCGEIFSEGSTSPQLPDWRHLRASVTGDEEDDHAPYSSVAVKRWKLKKQLSQT